MALPSNVGNGVALATSDFLARSDPLPPSEYSARDVCALPKIRVGWFVRVDWLETSEAHVFTVDLPGLKKDEIKVQIEDGRILQIFGERKEEDVQETDKWHETGRGKGSFRRNFRIPDNIKLDEVKAQIASGVLTITVPKEQNKPHDRCVEITD